MQESALMDSSIDCLQCDSRFHHTVIWMKWLVSLAAANLGRHQTAMTANKRSVCGIGIRQGAYQCGPRVKGRNEADVRGRRG